MLTLPQIVFRFRIAVFLYWAMSAALLGYWVVYMEGEKRMATSEIGMLMSMYVSSAFLGQYGFGFLSDKLESIRLPVAIAAFSFAVVIASLPLQSSKTMIAPSMMLLGFLQQPIGPMLDSWTLKHLSRYDQRSLFGQIRSFGSLGWATMALLTAYMILYISWNMMFAIAVVAGLSLTFVVLAIPDVAVSDSDMNASHPRLTIGTAISHLFGNSAYLYMLCVVFLMYLGVQTNFNFQGLLIKSTGGGLQELGWTFFIGVMSEMPAMFLSVWLLPRFAARKLMIVAGGLYLSRFALILFFQTSWIVMATACLDGFAFGLMLTSLRSYVFSVVADDVQTSAMTIIDATFLGLSVIIGGLIAGWLIEHFSALHMVMACSISCGLAMALLLIGDRLDLQSSPRDTESSLASRLGKH